MAEALSRPGLFDAEPEVKTFRLSELLSSVRRALEESFTGSYRIVAEVANISVNRSGHVYLELTETNDRGQKVASTRATIWSGVAARVMRHFKEVTGDIPRVGMELLLTVRVAFHEQYGFSLNILDIDPNHTLGNLERIRRESIARLQRAGILDLNKTQFALPTLTKRLAVISSETAAGWGDFRDQMRKSALAGLFRFELFTAAMQGPTTTATVIEALDRVYERAGDFDAVIILRGGGSPLDLSAFDDYDLCEYIANFGMPVITAIGHERDVSVADMVANTSVKTPTAAAEFLIHRLEEQVARVQDHTVRLRHMLREQYHMMEIRFGDYPARFSNLLRSLSRREDDRMRRREHRLASALHAHHSREKDRVARLVTRTSSILYHTKGDLRAQATRAAVAQKQLQSFLTHLVPQSLERLDGYARLIDLYNPEKIMRRGFLPVLQGDRSLASVEEVDPEQPLHILMPDGSVEGRVTGITRDKD